LYLTIFFIFSYFSISLPIFFLFNDPSTSLIYTLSLHDALPIYLISFLSNSLAFTILKKSRKRSYMIFSLIFFRISYDCLSNSSRSEEHTSELQSRFDLVCRLLLEKKKNK